MSIRLRVALTIIGSLLLVALATSALVGHVLEHNVEMAAGDSLWRAAATFRTLERSGEETLTASLDALVAREDLKRAFLGRDREALQRLAAPILRQLHARDGITHWYFADGSLTCFLRVHRPELHGDVLERPTARKAAETGQLVAGMDLGRTAFALRVVRPYYDGARLIGYMELAEEIDHFLRRLKEGTGDDFGLLVKKQYLDRAAWEAMQAPRRSTWDDRRDVVLVDATSYGQGIIDYQGDLDGVPARGKVLEETLEGGRSFIRGIFPVDDVAGRRVGALFVRHEITALHQAIEASRLQGRLAVFAAALLLAVCLFLILDAMVLRRAIRLSRLSQRLSERLPSERFGAGPEVITASEDELTRLEDFFRRFSRALGEDEGKTAPPPKR